jgi:hypothetical protein
LFNYDGYGRSFGGSSWIQTTAEFSHTGVADQPFYFKDLFSLKQELDKIVLPPNASIITFDAVSMYTNIDINDSIERISTFLANTWNKKKCKAIKSAMEIVMKNN